MWEVLDVIGPLAGAAMGVYYGRRITPEQKQQQQTFTCPYDGLTFVGIDSLDALNHVGCYARSEEDLKKRAEVPVTLETNDDYFHEIKSYQWLTWTHVPVRYEQVAVYTNGKYYAWRTKVWRNGDLIAEERFGKEADAKNAVDRIITTDQHKRKRRKS